MLAWRRCINPTTWRRSVRSRSAFRQLPQIACFDTAFHHGRSAVADHYAIPEHFYAQGVRRYGFHGLVVFRPAPARRDPTSPQGVIVAHSGSGASMCAVGGRSVESTMG